MRIVLPAYPLLIFLNYHNVESTSIYIYIYSANLLDSFASILVMQSTIVGGLDSFSYNIFVL